MDTPEGNSRRSWSGPQGGSGPRGTAGGTRATVLGSLTIPGRPEQVATARAFVARTLTSHQVGADCDAATLLTSEIVTNAIQHTKSGVDGGTVTVVVIGVPHGVLVEIIDGGSAGTPIVKGDLYAAEGHGLFLVQHLAAQWGYLRDPAGTTVWFHLPAAGFPPRRTGTDASGAESAALAAEGAAAGRRAVRAMHLTGVVHALGGGVRAALALERLAELTLRLVQVGRGGSLRCGVLRGGSGAGDASAPDCSTAMRTSCGREKYPPSLAHTGGFIEPVSRRHPGGTDNDGYGATEGAGRGAGDDGAG